MSYAALTQQRFKTQNSEGERQTPALFVPLRLQKQMCVYCMHIKRNIKLNKTLNSAHTLKYMQAFSILHLLAAKVKEEKNQK